MKINASGLAFPAVRDGSATARTEIVCSGGDCIGAESSDVDDISRFLAAKPPHLSAEIRRSAMSGMVRTPGVQWKTDGDEPQVDPAIEQSCEGRLVR
jgi:hypothetical protein